MWIIISFSLFSAAAFYWLYLNTTQFLIIKKEKNLKLRGIAKKFALESMDDKTESKLQRWLISCAIASVAPCLWVGYFSWGTDYSFMIGLFPLLWYYFLTRYLLWEKHDLYDLPSKEQKQNQDL
ncbi:MAG: hypothetical protein OEZ13_10455 [Spirochaetia bacterium]|nr:hypothetical protein [Spirochaetia bacterium]